MHFSAKFAVTTILSAAIAGAVPIPSPPELGARRPLAELARRGDLLALLQARDLISARDAPLASTVQHFARADGSNACINGALDWILATAMGSDPSSSDNSTTASTADASSGGNSTQPAFVDACIEDVIDWAVTKLLALFNEGDNSTSSSTAAPPDGGESGLPVPSAVSSSAPAPSSDPSTDPSTDPSDPSSDPSASASASADGAAPSASASANSTTNADAPSPSDDGSDGSSRRALRSLPAVRRASAKQHLGNFVAKLMAGGH